METAKIRTMSLPVKLNEKEVALRAQELATEESTLYEAERKLESAVEAAKESKKSAENEIDKSRGAVRRLATIVREHREYREIPIVEESDYEAGAVNTIRTDSGEIVSTRGMTPEERQRSLFEAQKAKAGKKSS